MDRVVVIRQKDEGITAGHQANHHINMGQCNIGIYYQPPSINQRLCALLSHDQIFWVNFCKYFNKDIKKADQLQSLLHVEIPSLLLTILSSDILR